MPFRNPDRNWLENFLPHRTVRIDFSKICQKPEVNFPDGNLARQINPYPIPDKKCGEPEESVRIDHPSISRQNACRKTKNA
jgi:hypothetical protein